MRVGLVAIGLAFALVGAAVIVGILYPGDNPTVERTGSGAVPDLPGGEWRPICFPDSAESPATLTISWSSSAPANVSWYAVAVCPTSTTVGPPLLAWVDQIGGRWSGSGQTAALYELVVEAGGSRSTTLNFSATFTEQYHSGELTLPAIPFAITMVGGSLLTGIGAVVLYLGLFLPAGVYGPFDAVPPDEEERPPAGTAPPPKGPNPPA